MIDANEDIVNLGEQFVAPKGFELEYAVSTTYNLDLNALLLLPLAAFSESDLDGIEETGQIERFRMLHKSKGKFQFYCQKGKTAVVSRNSKFFPFVDQYIHEITLDDGKRSFHPKVTVIRFSKIDNKKEFIYRIIISSKNLTLSRNRELGFVADGRLERKPTRNSPLIEFLMYLNSKAPQSEEIPVSFINDLEKVRFKYPSGFNLENFHFLRGDRKSNIPIFRDDWDQVLIISPFLSESLIKQISENTKILILFSEDAELKKINWTDGCKNIVPYTYAGKTDILNEDYLEKNTNEIIQNDLHAKLFICVKGSKSHWFIGSANSTRNAFNSNIEFLVELISKEPLKLKDVVDELTRGKTILFNNYDPEEETYGSEVDLRELIFNISTKIQVNADFEKIGSAKNYLLNIEIDATCLKEHAGIDVFCKPLSCYNTEMKIKSGEKNYRNYTTPIKNYLVSPFIIWEIREESSSTVLKSFMTKMEVNLPANRLPTIASFINVKGDILKLIEGLLSGGSYDFDSFLEVEEDEYDLDEEITLFPLSSELNEKNIQRGLTKINLYDKVLFNLNRNPALLKEVDAKLKELAEADLEGEKLQELNEIKKFWGTFEGMY